MAGINMKIEAYTIDMKDVTEVINAFVNDAMRKGVKAFLRAALPRIPVRTGFVRGAFTEIVRRFDPQQTAFTKNILKAVSKKAGVRGEYYYHTRKSRILKSESSGIKFATPADKVIVILKNGTAKFELNVRITYYGINDFYSRIAGSPWYSLRFGQAAMEAYLDKAINRFPSIEQLRTETTYIVQGIRFSTTVARPNTQEIIRQLKTITPD